MTASRSSRACSSAGTQIPASRRAVSRCPSPNAPGRGDDTESTAIARPACSSGAATIDRISNPCLPDGTKRGSSRVSGTRTAQPRSRAQPAIPSPRLSAIDECFTPAPERALASRCSPAPSTTLTDA